MHAAPGAARRGETVGQGVAKLGRAVRPLARARVNRWAHALLPRPTGAPSCMIAHDAAPAASFVLRPCVDGAARPGVGAGLRPRAAGGGAGAAPGPVRVAAARSRRDARRGLRECAGDVWRPAGSRRSGRLEPDARRAAARDLARAHDGGDHRAGARRRGLGRLSAEGVTTLHAPGRSSRASRAVAARGVCRSCNGVARRHADVCCRVGAAGSGDTVGPASRRGGGGRAGRPGQDSRGPCGGRACKGSAAGIDTATSRRGACHTGGGSARGTGGGGAFGAGAVAGRAGGARGRYGGRGGRGA